MNAPKLAERSPAIGLKSERFRPFLFGHDNGMRRVRDRGGKNRDVPGRAIPARAEMASAKH
jgi:hypothetical protein